MNRIAQIAIKNRLLLTTSLTLFLTCVSYILSIGLRFDFEPQELFHSRLILPCILLMTFRYITYWYWGLNRGFWRHVSARDLVNLIKAHTACTLMFAATLLIIGQAGVPRTVIFIEYILSIVLLGGVRLLTRVVAEHLLPQITAKESGRERKVVVLGGGDSGHLVIKHLISQRRFNYRPVAVFDDSERLLGVTIHGVPVIGAVDELAQFLLKNPEVSAVILAIPSLSSAKTREIKTTTERAGVLFKQLQAFEDIACLEEEGEHSQLSIEALLEKKLHIEHEEEIFEELSGKRVVVTGAGGSIGSELVKQLLSFNLERLILIDHAEFNLYQVTENTKDWITESSNKTQIRSYIANVTDNKRISNIFKNEKPDFLFHAAAYKHVPLMEENCIEAFRNNVIGTREVLSQAEEHGLKRFVLVSTDKAVDPSSVMGCSKRMAELLVLEHRLIYPKSNLQTAVVRFGNVINSAGSVIPRFKEQIMRGGPITVTDPRMERYFMSIREAVRLILTAGVLGRHGEVYVLDMGNPVKIVDVAKKMIALYGRRDIEIKFCGIRQGEKLTEQLTMDSEKTAATRFTKVRKIEGLTVKNPHTYQAITEIESKIETLSDKDISRLMLVAVTEENYELTAGAIAV